MNERVLFSQLAHIIGNQCAIMDYLANAHNMNPAQIEEHKNYMINEGVRYAKALLPDMLKQANLDWDINDLLKP
jgi:hypothetical protein